MDTQINNRNDTNFLRFIAILLIINSHLDKFYPIKYIGTGGAIGNALFFTLSTFGLTLSINNNSTNFIQWYSKRIARIFPSVWAVIILLLFPKAVFYKSFNIENILSFLGQFFYPPFWFLQALLIFYILGYPLIKNYSTKKMFITFSILSIVYCIYYLTYVNLSVFSIEDGFISYLSNFLSFLFGIFLAKNNSKISYKGFVEVVFLFISIFIIYGHKYLMTKNIFPEFQFVQHLMLFPFIYYFLKVSRSLFVQQFIMQSLIKKAIIYISGITLELYMVHSALQRVFLQLDFKFPVNILLFLLASFSIAGVIKVISDKFIRKAILA
jgi:peptidoglycan/LPS O-acetylase OafA/YrhL